MTTITEIFKEILAVVGIFSLFYFGGYVIELGRLKARKTLHACDICFGKMKRMNED